MISNGNQYMASMKALVVQYQNHWVSYFIIPGIIFYNTQSNSCMILLNLYTIFRTKFWKILSDDFVRKVFEAEVMVCQSWRFLMHTIV